MATKAIKHFRLRELARAPPPILQPASTSTAPRRVNPFVPTKNPKTGRWAPPKYSLRQQADLVKKARASGTLGLLPPSLKTSAAHVGAVSFAKAQPACRVAEQTATESKAESGSSERWAEPIEWVGDVRERRVAGAEIGNRLYAGKKRMFKGHKWERVADRRALKRRVLMRDMAARIQRYKQHYKRRRPSPLKPSKSSGGKLPF